jgi:hypothetical protein
MVSVRLTLPVKPLREAIVIFEAADTEALTAAGEVAAIVKSGAVKNSVMAVASRSGVERGAKPQFVSTVLVHE